MIDECLVMLEEIKQWRSTHQTSFNLDFILSIENQLLTNGSLTDNQKVALENIYNKWRVAKKLYNPKRPLTLTCINKPELYRAVISFRVRSVRNDNVYSRTVVIKKMKTLEQDCYQSWSCL